MHETVMEVMVNVLGEGESKVRRMLRSIIRRNSIYMLKDLVRGRSIQNNQ